MWGKRILILVPHPDDEVVACAAAIGRAQAQGTSVFALYLTHGCIARETLWPWQRRNYDKIVERRTVEAENSALFFNLLPVWGWPPLPARHLWRNLPEAYAALKAAVATHAIDQLWVPAYEGGNADHDATNALGAKFQKSDKAISVLEFAEYNFFEGKTRAQEFPFPNGSEQILILTPEEQEKKRAALSIYKSERGNLNYVGTARENFRPLAKYDYSRPPHPGILWYARFQWVPFRHPRVDFTDPRHMCDVLTRFVSGAAAQ